jgi:1-acyl-sn-glycerol-3-phosphate acyltransferase
MFRFIAWLYFKIFGWEVVGSKPGFKKFIVIVLPHTSRFDFFLVKTYGVLFGIKSKGLVKKEMFFFPLNLIIRALGAIPVDREHNRRLADALIREFNSREQFGLTLTPEATRKKVRRLKRGFYYIAQATGVPVLMGFIDFKTKRLGIGPEFKISGDFDTDVKQIRDFYQGMEGLHPGRFDASLLR